MTSQRAVAVIGVAGIGREWARICAAAGLHVRLFDPTPDIEGVAQGIRQAAAVIDAGRVQPAAGLDDAVIGADVVFECGPDRAGAKQQALVDIVLAAPTDSLLVTAAPEPRADSFGGAEVAALARGLDDIAAARLVAMRLAPDATAAEVIAGRGSSPESVERALALCRAVGLHVQSAEPDPEAERTQTAAR
jgi:hypothetical protein